MVGAASRPWTTAIAAFHTPSPVCRGAGLRPQDSRHAELRARPAARRLLTWSKIVSEGTAGNR